MIDNNINPYIIHCGYLNQSNCSPPDTVYPERIVKWYEIELILWGRGHIFNEDEKILAVGNRVFFRKPGMLVQGVSPYYCYLIVFDLIFDESKKCEYEDPFVLEGKTLNSGFGNEFAFPEFFDTQNIEGLRKRFEEIYVSYIYHGRDDQFKKKTNLMRILLEINEELSNEKNSGFPHANNFGQIMGAKRFIEENVCLKLTLKEIAEVSNFSPNFFCYIFKKIVGQTPIKYLNSCKINKAKKMLIETDLTIKEIVYELGFANQTYFFTLFKKHENTSPSTYRAKHNISKYYTKR